MEYLLGIDSVGSDIFQTTSKVIKKNQMKTSTSQDVKHTVNRNKGGTSLHKYDGKELSSDKVISK